MATVTSAFLRSFTQNRYTADNLRAFMGIHKKPERQEPQEKQQPITPVKQEQQSTEPVDPEPEPELPDVRLAEKPPVLGCLYTDF